MKVKHVRARKTRRKSAERPAAWPMVADQVSRRQNTFGRFDRPASAPAQPWQNNAFSLNIELILSSPRAGAAEPQEHGTFTFDKHCRRGQGLISHI